MCDGVRVCFCVSVSVRMEHMSKRVLCVTVLRRVRVPCPVAGIYERQPCVCS